jgi:adenylate kinase
MTGGTVVEASPYPTPLRAAVDSAMMLGMWSGGPTAPAGGRRARRVVLLGAPGSGKSTQAARLAASLGVPHIAVGDLLRAAVARRTPLGREAASYMERGQLVPDRHIRAVLMEGITPQAALEGYVLDGYPRSAEQAADTEAMGGPPDAVVHLWIPDQEAVRRLAGRRYCPEGHVYHVEDAPSRFGVRCELDGSRLVVRADDREEVVRDRLVLYHRRIDPLLNRYAHEGLLVEVNATGDPEDVVSRILDELGAAGGFPSA